MEGYQEEVVNAYALIERGKANEAILKFREIAHLAEKDDDIKTLSRSLIGAAEAAETAVTDEHSSYTRDAFAYLEVALRLAKEINDQYLIYKVGVLRGIILIDVGSCTQAETELTQLISGLSQTSYYDLLARCYSSIGLLNILIGKVEKAKSYSAKASGMYWHVPLEGLLIIKCKVNEVIVGVKTGEDKRSSALFSEIEAWVKADHEGRRYDRLWAVLQTLRRSLFSQEISIPTRLADIDPYVSRAIQIRYDERLR